MSNVTYRSDVDAGLVHHNTVFKMVNTMKRVIRELNDGKIIERELESQVRDTVALLILSLNDVYLAGPLLQKAGGAYGQ